MVNMMVNRKRKIILIILSGSLVISVLALFSLIFVYINQTNNDDDTIAYSSIAAINGNAIKDTITDEEAASVLADSGNA